MIIAVPRFGLERGHPCLHERRLQANKRRPSLTPLNHAALQAGMPAFQSRCGGDSYEH